MILKSEWLSTSQAAARACLDGDVLTEIRAFPGFRDLLRPWMETWRIKPGDGAILVRMLRDLGRFVSGIWVLQLHASPGGLTLARLAESLGTSKLSSGARARSILIYLRFIGYVEPAPHGPDRRERRWQPTPAMKQAFKDRIHRDIMAFWPADPALLAIGQAFQSDAVFDAYMVAMGELLRASLADYAPKEASLDRISGRFGGFAVLGEMLLSDPKATVLPPKGPLPVTLAGLARDTQLSRAQVRDIQRLAVEEGFLEAHSDGTFSATPLLAEHLEMLLAGVLVSQGYAGRRAQAALQATNEEAELAPLAV